MKKTKCLLAVILALALCLSLLPSIALAADTYKKVSRLSDVTAGGQFVLVANNLAMDTTLQTNKKFNGIGVTSGGDALSGSLPVWTFETVEAGIAISCDGQYLAYDVSTNFKMQDEAYTWTVSVGDAGFVINPVASTSRGIFMQISSSRFGAYSTTNTSGYIFGLELYKLDDGSASCEHNYVCTVIDTVSCTKNGQESYTCSECGDTYTKTIAACGHNYVVGTCINCGGKIATDSAQIVAQGTCGDNAWWELDVLGTLSISGSGEMYNYYFDYNTECPNTPWYQYRHDVYAVIVHSGITSIGDFAFCDYQKLTNITIADSVSSMGAYAFCDCRSLTGVVIPDSVTCIGSSAFSGCSSLNSITIPERVTSVQDYAFSNCSSLTSVTISGGVTSIGDHAFYSCSSLTNVAIPGGVARIGRSAFESCSSLTDVIIPSSVTIIGNYSFAHCSSLVSVTIPDGVTKIGEGAFTQCSGLTNVTIANSVTSVGQWAFSNCSSLTSVTISEGLTIIGDYVFYSCSSLTDVTIPSRVNTIGKEAFYSCSSLISVFIPDSVTVIAEGAFAYCNSLTSVTIPERVTYLNANVFSYCRSLTSVTLHKKVYVIGEEAFSNCLSLTSVKFMGSAPTFVQNCFGGVNADVYYSCVDTSWTSAVKKNYGGNLTWREHLFDDYVYNQDATCTEDGTQTRSCADCDAEETMTVSHTAFGHSYETVTVDATCTEDGSITMTCATCGDSQMDVISATGHHFVGNVCDLCGYGIGVTISGTITSFAEGSVTLILAGNGIEETLITDDVSYTLNATPGDYILTVSKASHVTRQYTITLGSDSASLDVKINLIGDVTGDGSVNVGDVSKLYAHIRGTAPITDEYQLLCGNANGGSVNVGDVSAIYAHIKGTKKLY